MGFSNKRKLKGNKDKMFIAENLTKYRYDLLRQLNGMTKINKVHSFWTHDGSILVKERENYNSHGKKEETLQCEQIIKTKIAKYH
jgi:hypothetical protein